MFKILLIGIALLLFVGAIRRWFFAGAWRLLVPLIVGFFIGVPLAAAVVGSGAPAAVIIIAPIFAGLIIAGTFKTVLDDILGPPKG
jgi:hypothetical protein